MDTRTRDKNFDEAIDAIVNALPGASPARTRGRPSAEASRTLTILAEDGFPLAASLYLPVGTPRARLLMAPAMGVKRAFYGRFLAYLAERGIASLVIDYRGIGESSATEQLSLSLSDWGEQDLAAATNTLCALVPSGESKIPTLFAGHSVGGQLFGLMRDAPFDRALFIGSQAGYWGHWSGVSRLGMLALWFGAVPLFTSTLGYLPMKALGQGENIPSGVAREWARWGRDPQYVGVRAAEIDRAGYSHWKGTLRSIAVEDDAYAPTKAVRELVKLYGASEGEVVTVSPKELGTRRLGHFGLFRSKFRDSFWDEAASWLLDRAA